MSKCIPYRPHDYMYDPIFTVSGPVDHFKAAIVAKMSQAKFQLCPVFPNMFSDLPNHPNMQLVCRRTKPVMSYEEKLDGSNNRDPTLKRSVDVCGKDRPRFFCPVVNLPPKDFQDCSHSMPIFTIEKLKTERGATATTIREVEGESGKVLMRDAQVETIYRESSAQTVPWEPSYEVIGEGDPEILKLDFLKWGSGLPAGMHEVSLIERARMKRAWENVIKPDISDESSLEKFRDFVAALERDEWAFREKEIQEIQELRLHLLEKMLNEIHHEAHNRGEQKLNNFIQRKEKEKQEKLEKVRKKASRDLRKLEQKYRGLDRRYREPNIIEEHVSKRSELYGPLLRNGENPKRWHHVIDERMKKYKAQFIGVEQFSTLPRWLDQATNLPETECIPKGVGPQLCIRETKWTAPVLKLLHEELQNLRKETTKKPCNLRVRNEAEEQEYATPEVEGIPEQQEEQYQALIFMQSLIKGRAVQMMIYEGRDNCKELIQELKNSIGLLKKQKELRSKEKMKVRAQQREEAIQCVMVSRLQGTLGKLQGQVVGTVLDFLNKELRRLLEERKAHAMCWVNERERNIREAAEAGRRQKEIRRRKEHDEIFKQIVKVSQESVDVYLRDIITEGMEFASKEEATNYVLKLATKIENEIQEVDRTKAQLTFDEQDEMIADMVHHFVLPEVQKNIVRQKRIAKQKQNLKTIHETVYSHVEENLPKTEREPKSVPRYLSLKDLIGTDSEGKVMFSTDETPDISTHIIQGPYDQSPDILELYLNRLAIEDEMAADQDFHMVLPTTDELPVHQRAFNMDLETIPETNESVTTETHLSTELEHNPSLESDQPKELQEDLEETFEFEEDQQIFNLGYEEPKLDVFEENDKHDTLEEGDIHKEEPEIHNEEGDKPKKEVKSKLQDINEADTKPSISKDQDQVIEEELIKISADEKPISANESIITTKPRPVTDTEAIEEPIVQLQKNLDADHEEPENREVSNLDIQESQITEQKEEQDETAKVDQGHQRTSISVKTSQTDSINDQG